jgi:hypothetical protein
MTTVGTTRTTLIATLALSLACIFAFGTTSAAASERFSEHRGNFRVVVRGGYHGSYHGSYHSGYQEYCAPPVEYCVQKEWVPGYYETVTQHVLVCAEQIEHRYFEPVYETRCDPCGRHIQVCVRPGYYKDFCTPARYEDRCVKVFHEGFYREVAQY